MGKHAAGTAKAVGKAIKARGLKKLRFFCQACEKQCRDANGFKCHLSSEPHLRRMEMVATNQSAFIARYSQQFEKGFLDILSRRHNTKRVKANFVYNEYIQDRLHVHLNATQWSSLSAFAQHLGESGQCLVDCADGEWYVRWLDPAARAAQQQQTKKRSEEEADDDKRQRQALERQIAAAKARQAVVGDVAEAAVDPASAPLPLGLVLGKKRRRPVAAGNAEDEDEDEDEDVTRTGTQQQQQQHPSSGGMASLAKIVRREEEGARARAPSPPPPKLAPMTPGTWLVPGLVVKIASSSVRADGASLKKRKAVVRRILMQDGKARCELQVVSDGAVAVAKQSQVETVIPDLGRNVRVVSADTSFPHRGRVGTLVDVNVKRFKATVALGGNERLELEYDNLCKLEEQGG